MRLRQLLPTVALLLAPTLAAAQARPAGWRVAADEAGVADTALAFVTMAPGWHLTAGPGGALYDTAHALRGRFRAESELYVFSKEAGEGVGLLVGGAGLDGADARYTALVVGPDGRFRVVRREGAALRELVPWTAHPAVVPKPADQPNVREVLAVVADDTNVAFEVNGTVVATLPRAVAAPDGIVGLRMEPRANAHVATLALDGRNVAPRPAAGDRH